VTSFMIWIKAGIATRQVKTTSFPLVFIVARLGPFCQGVTALFRLFWRTICKWSLPLTSPGRRGSVVQEGSKGMFWTENQFI
jgi:hypothetical protein